jgi:hypothetical protein
MADEYFNARLLRLQNTITVLENGDTSGWGEGQRVAQFTNLMFELIGGGTPDINVKVYVAYQDEEPVWTDPVSASNRYYPVGCLDLDPQSAIIAGSTGISVSEGGKHYIVSAQGAKWINFQITRVDGEVNIYLNPYNNQ